MSDKLIPGGSILDAVRDEETRKRYSIFILGSVVKEFETLCKQKGIRVSRALERYMQVEIEAAKKAAPPVATKARPRTSR